MGPYSLLDSVETTLLLRDGNFIYRRGVLLRWRGGVDVFHSSFSSGIFYLMLLLWRRKNQTDKQTYTHTHTLTHIQRQRIIYVGYGNLFVFFLFFASSSSTTSTPSSDTVAQLHTSCKHSEFIHSTNSRVQHFVLFHFFFLPIFGVA